MGVGKTPGIPGFSNEAMTHSGESWQLFALGQLRDAEPRRRGAARGDRNHPES